MVLYSEINHPWLHFPWLLRQIANVFQILVISKAAKDNNIEANSSDFGEKMFFDKGL